MQPYAELLEFNQPNLIRMEGFTRIRDQFPELQATLTVEGALANTGNIYDPERISEFSGRFDYGAKNAAKLGQPSVTGKPIMKRWMDSGEQSMLEMAHATVFFECSRVCTHELVRHRLASYQQESQRFTLQVLDEEAFFIPPNLDKTIVSMLTSAYMNAGQTYEALLTLGVPKQIARYVLPNATSTRIIMSANLREWRHVFKLRMDKSAQPEIQDMMQQAYMQMLPVFPQSLEGITEEGRGVR